MHLSIASLMLVVLFLQHPKRFQTAVITKQDKSNGTIDNTKNAIGAIKCAMPPNIGSVREVR